MNAIRFMHIPKTAGTSLVFALRRIYPGEEFNFLGNLALNPPRFAALSAAEREQIRLVRGHSPRYTRIPEIDRLPTFTILRDPVERVISFCQHVREAKSPEYLAAFPPEDFDLDAFLDSGDGQLYNLQTQMLLGIFSHEVEALGSEAAFARAFEILSTELDAFGITQHFDDSLLLLRKAFDWPWPVYRRVNTKDASLPIPVTPAHRQRIAAMNQIDQRLYQAASELFAQRLADYGWRLPLDRLIFKNQLKRFQKQAA